MANTTETATFNVKSNIGDVSKDASNAAGEFKLMGVSLNGVKKGFASAALTAKGMFGSIKAGLISTGIGAFVVIIGSLISFLTKTKRGSEMLERAMAGLGAVVSVVTDLFSSVGEVMVSAFTNPKQAVSDLWEFIKTNLMNRLTGLVDGFTAAGKIIESSLSLDWKGVKEGAEDYGKALIQVGTGMDVEQQKDFIKGIKNIATEMDKESSAAMRLKGMLQQLKDEERDFSKVRAQTRQDIQKARLDALDESKTAEERLAALQKANDLELGTTEKSLEMQRKKIEVQKETMALSENMAEDLDELAALEVGLIDLQTQSFQTQKRLATEMETLKNEIVAADKARSKEKLDLIEDEKKAKLKAIADEKKAADDLYDAQIAQADALDLQFDKFTEDEKKRLEDKKKFEIDMANKGLSALATAAGEGTKLAKAAAIAQATISGIQGVQNAFTAANANIGATAGTFGVYPVTMAALAGSFAAVNIAKIASGGKPGSGGGGAGAGAGAGGGAPAPQMMSGAFDISGGVAPEATRAYVLTDEMTNSQDLLANIRRRATI